MPTLSAHQPHFFPWPSYFLKILKSDIFVILDDVQFRKNYFQNRCEIISIDDSKRQWLTIPIKRKLSSKSKINEITFSEGFMVNDILSKLESSYLNTPFYNQVYQDLKELLKDGEENLSDFNSKGILWCMEKLNIDTKVVFSSDINTFPENNPTKKLINFCLHYNAESYLSGLGGRNYMELSLFKENEVNLIWHDSKNFLFKYNQTTSNFISNLSILDMFFNIGYKESEELLKIKLDY
tara:strand:- start:725 stop:1438 length:714 start_codon:yes stop_codon:yes gene_type:complete